MSGKRRRSDEDEVCEALGGLLRQTAARAVERIRMQRQQRGAGGLAIVPAWAADAIFRTAKPMDILVIRFCVHYLDCAAVAPPNHFVRLAQDVVTTSVERILIPQLFAKGTGSLPALCESLVAEHTADEIQIAMREVNEFVEARGALGAWLADAARTGGQGDEDEDEEEEDAFGGGRYGWNGSPTKEEEDQGYDARLKNEEDKDGYQLSSNAARGGDDTDDVNENIPDSAREDFALAAALYQACEYWVRVQAFLNALSLHSARLHVFHMPPRYEKELLLMLYTATRGRATAPAIESTVSLRVTPAGATKNLEETTATEEQPSRAPPPSLPVSTKVPVKDDGSTVAVKQEPAWDLDDQVEGDKASLLEYQDSGEHDATSAQPSSPVRPPHQLYKASALLADVLALSRCPEPSAATNSTAVTLSSSLTASAAARLSPQALQHLRGINPNFYKMVYARLGVMVARERLHRFDQTSSVPPPPLTVQQRNLQEQQQQQQQQQQQTAAAEPGLAGQEAAGLPTGYVPDDTYYDKLLHQQHETIEEDEEVYKGEVMDYYLTHPNRNANAAGAASSASAGNASRARQNANARRNTDDNGETALIKPHRFCKVKTGFSWTQYNRTHYDSRTNPPPRTEMWYEFTLFYPLLANTKRDMRQIFRIEDAPEGPNDQYCLLVFSVGPPYADVAYRIRKKQWDTRRGGVRISFDQTGRFKLFFRFTNSNYRR